MSPEVFATNDILGGASSTEHAQVTMLGASDFLEPKSELILHTKAQQVKNTLKHCTNHM